MKNPETGKIWIDLDNSPHVPFFSPIIKELEKQGFEAILTARNCFQVCGLADLFKMKYTRVGRHYGRNKVFKVLGTLLRALQLLPVVARENPLLAVSHGSRSQLIAATMLRIPSIVIFDYEHSQRLVVINPTWEVAPDTIADKLNHHRTDPILEYPGLKEDVYAIEFAPDRKFRSRLNLSEDEIVVTIRPPATEAHYHNPEAEILFVDVVDRIGRVANTRMVILPRNEITQTKFVQKKWPQWCENKKIIIPDHVVNGLDLIWASDLVVSGGGTMNREAAALGVPVYSIFRGKLGLIDKKLSETGRLVLIGSKEDVSKKIKLEKRTIPDSFTPSNRAALKEIVNIIASKARRAAA